MSLNAYLNRLLREDYERVLKVSTDFMERTHKKLSGDIDWVWKLKEAKMSFSDIDVEVIRISPVTHGSNLHVLVDVRIGNIEIKNFRVIQ